MAASARERIRRTRPTTIVVLVAMLAILLTSPGLVLAQDTDGFEVHCVNVTLVDPRFDTCDDDHATVQDAVEHAESGESVLVGPGTYAEQVVITRPLTL